MNDQIFDRIYCYNCDKVTMHTITVTVCRKDGLYGRLACNICGHGYGIEKPARFSPYWQQRLGNAEIH